MLLDLPVLATGAAHGLRLALERCAMGGEDQRGGPAVSEHDDILTTEEAAKLLRVSESTLERWRVRRRIPYVEYPRQGTWAPIRFRRTDILEWLRQHVVKPNRNGDQPA
jgi:excisionase family DNA binding protein